MEYAAMAVNKFLLSMIESIKQDKTLGLDIALSIDRIPDKDEGGKRQTVKGSQRCK
jgi:hypothetical protein